MVNTGSRSQAKDDGESGGHAPDTHAAQACRRKFLGLCCSTVVDDDLREEELSDSGSVAYGSEIVLGIVLIGHTGSGGSMWGGWGCCCSMLVHELSAQQSMPASGVPCSWIVSCSALLRWL